MKRPGPCEAYCFLLDEMFRIFLTLALISHYYDLFALSVPPQDEWRLHELPKEELSGPEEHDRELTQLFLEVWAEDNPPCPQAG